MFFDGCGDHRDRHSFPARRSADLESACRAGAAEEAGWPFAVLRVVGDPADRTLPPVAGCVLSPDGGLKIGALLLSLLRAPGQIGGLINLGRDAAKARTAMLAFFQDQDSRPAFRQLAQ